MPEDMELRCAGLNFCEAVELDRVDEAELILLQMDVRETELLAGLDNKE